eukprot:scaffold293503_cov37-Prasinocladus_malaysianus.AAC.1
MSEACEAPMASWKRLNLYRSVKFDGCRGDFATDWLGVQNIWQKAVAIYGAITMNNTLCLGIFLAIVHVRGLTWDFSAEVTAMVGVILLIGALGGSRNTFRLGWVVPVTLLYPMSLLGKPAENH